MTKPINEMREILNKIRQISETTNDSYFGDNAVIIDAYSEDDDLRNLDIRGVPVSLDDWHELMIEALADWGGQYNNFDITKVYPSLRTLPEVDKLGFIPGREGSVVLYITTNGNAELAKQVSQHIGKDKRFIKFDELFMKTDDTVRIWWD
jgi:hypothetical protein